MVEIVSYFNHFGELTDSIIEDLDAVVRSTTADIVFQAKARAPVDRGVLRESIYGVTDQGSTYSYAVARAEIQAQFPQGRNASSLVGAGSLIKMGASGEEFHDEETPGEHEGLVGVAASYGFYVENGTTRNTAQPFLTPAVAAAAPKFERDIGDVLK